MTSSKALKRIRMGFIQELFSNKLHFVEKSSWQACANLCDDLGFIWIVYLAVFIFGGTLSYFSFTIALVFLWRVKLPSGPTMRGLCIHSERFKKMRNDIISFIIRKG
jgi:hypothetical protein